MRPSDHPGNPAVRLLTRLAERHDRAAPGAKPPSLRVDHADVTAGEADLAERLLLQAEKLGAVTIERPRHARHMLERVRLRDAALLAEFLGRTPAGVRASAVLDAVAPLLVGAPDWIQDVVEEALGRWNEGDRAYRLDAGRTDRIVDLVRILLAVDRGIDGRDLRSFSVAAGVDSKAFERHRGTILQIVRGAYGLEGMAADEVMAAIGLRPFLQPVHLRGPIGVPAMSLDCALVRPYVALPPAVAAAIELSGDVDAVLTIENFASFNRHVAEIEQERVVVVYSGGFPSSAVVAALRALAGRLPDAVFLHWGDIDAGGARIFRNLEERIGRCFAPHLMTAELAERSGVLRPAVPRLGRIAEEASGIAAIAAYLSRGTPRHLEQEMVDPAPVDLLFNTLERVRDRR